MSGFWRMGWIGGGSDGGWRGSSDRDHFTPGDRTGRNNYRIGGCDGHPSGAPRQYEGGRCGRGSGCGYGRVPFDGNRDDGDPDGYLDQHDSGCDKREYYLCFLGYCLIKGINYTFNY